MNSTKRKWLQFSIRDVLFVTLIVALLVGWWIDHDQLTRKAYLKVELLKEKIKVLKLQTEIEALKHKHDGSNLQGAYGRPLTPSEIENQKVNSASELTGGSSVVDR